MNALPPGYSWRPFSVADYDDALALWRDTESMGLGDGDSREGITLFLERNPGLSTVLHAPDGKLVGAVLCGHDGRRGYLHHLAVAKAERGQGFGRMLVEVSLANLRALGLNRCSIFLYADNVAGRAFWQHAGWRQRGDIVILQHQTHPG